MAAPKKTAPEPENDFTPSITTEEVPLVVQRTTKPNPFVPYAERLVIDSPEGFGFDVPADKLGSVLGQLSRAGEITGKTLRRVITDNPDGTKHVKVRATERIKRPRKTTD